MYRLVSAIVATMVLAACSRAPAIPEGPTEAPGTAAPVAAAGGGPGAAASAAEAPPALPMGPERHILAVGDSLLAGYGLGSPADAYPARLEQALRARGINARVTNASVSGDTSGAGAERFGFVLKSQPVRPDLVILEFGGNDLLRAIPPEETRANLERMLAEAKQAGLPVLLMGMLAPPNLGPAYKAKFEPIYPELARKYGAARISFFLAPVIGKADLIQPDHVHPNARGVAEIVAATADQVAQALPAMQPQRVPLAADPEESRPNG